MASDKTDFECAISELADSEMLDPEFTDTEKLFSGLTNSRGARSAAIQTVFELVSTEQTMLKPSEQ